jgi:tetratricopeptide (TPR) repeat protein
MPHRVQGAQKLSAQRHSAPTSVPHDRPSSVPAAQRATECDPRFLEAWNNRANALLALGNLAAEAGDARASVEYYRRALDSLAAAIDIDPTHRTPLVFPPSSSLPKTRASLHTPTMARSARSVGHAARRRRATRAIRGR